MKIFVYNGIVWRVNNTVALAGDNNFQFLHVSGVLLLSTFDCFGIAFGAAGTIHLPHSSSFLG